MPDEPIPDFGSFVRRLAEIEQRLDALEAALRSSIQPASNSARAAPPPIGLSPASGRPAGRPAPRAAPVATAAAKPGSAGQRRSSKEPLAARLRAPDLERTIGLKWSG